MLKTNKKNPRKIGKGELEKLKASIQKYPNILAVRPIVIESDENPTIIAGNMRYLALQELGYKEIPREWVVTAEQLSQEEREALVLLDNAHFGTWDFELLQGFDFGFLEDFCIDFPKYEEDSILPEEPKGFEFSQEKEDKQAKMTITFLNVKDLERAKGEIEAIASKYGATISVSAGKL